MDVSGRRGMFGRRIFLSQCELVHTRRPISKRLIGVVSDWMRIRGQAARSIGLSASFWVRLCHPSTLRIVI